MSKAPNGQWVSLGDMQDSSAEVVMGRKRSALTPSPCTHEVNLVVRKTKNTVTAAVLHSGCMWPDEEDEFAWFVEEVRQKQWSVAFDRLKGAHDKKWDYNYWWLQSFNKARDRAIANRFKAERVDLVVLKAIGLIQGLMVVGPSEEVNLPPTSKNRLLYLAYMATAPWNRRPFRRPKEMQPEALKGVGKALVKQAICLSKDLGYGGRLGLRAMGGSAEFYASLGMTEVTGKVKYQEHERDPWFELTDTGAQTILANVGP